MTQGSGQEGGGGMDSSWPAGAGADAPAAPVAAGGGAMTVGGILTVAGILLAFVGFAFGLVSLQYCFSAFDRGAAQEEASGRRGGGSSRGNARNRGVDPELLRALPVTVYRAAKGEAVECAVCLAELEDGEEARFLPRCGHGFHAECVDMWLESHSTCPLCRLVVAKPDGPSSPAVALALPPMPPEPPASYSSNLPASVLLGLSDQGCPTVTPGGDRRASTGTAAVLVIEIPELAVPPAMTPRDAAAKSPGSATLRSIRRLWSFGRQGAGPSSSRTCGASEGADLEQGASVALAIAVAAAPLPSEAAVGASATRGAAP